MRITLIHLDISYVCVEPLGIVYIGTVLKNSGHEVQLMDLGPDETAYDKIVQFAPDIIGFSLATTSYHRSLEVIKELKKKLPNTMYCAGGVHPTNLPRQTLEELGLDFVVVGEGEYTIREICERLEQKKSLKGVKGIVYKDSNGKIITNERRELIENLDELPIPNRDLLPNYSWYLSPPGVIRGKFYDRTVRVVTNRGCFSHCIFCTTHSLFGRKNRRRSVENVILEIEELIKKYSIKGIYFSDDTFTIDPDWVNRFCKMLKERNTNLVWSCQVRVDTVSEKLLRNMKSAGCIQIEIGAESGSDKVLKNLKKGITVKKIKEAFELAKKVGLRTLANFIVGSPGETIEDIDETKKLIKIIKSNMTEVLIMVPYPGSEMFDMAKKEGWFIQPKLEFSKEWSLKQSEEPLMEINFKKEEQMKIRAEIENMVLLRNHMFYAIGFLENPKHMLKFTSAIIKYRKDVFKAVLGSITTGKMRLMPEIFYQSFMKYLKESSAKQSNYSK